MKRGVSSTNVECKSRRLGQELGILQDRREKLEFQHDLQEHMKDMKANPKKLAKARIAANLDTNPAHDKKADFHPTTAAKTLAKVPVTHLSETWFPQHGITKAEMAKLMVCDKAVAHKMLYRLTMRRAIHAFGHQNKDAWDAQHNWLVKFFEHEALKIFKWNAKYEMEWDQCGHFMLLPPLPVTADPAEHLYTHIAFKGIEELLVKNDDDPKVRGSWYVENNWSHVEAFVWNPDKPWTKRGCVTFFAEQKIDELVPQQCLAIKNINSANASSPGLEMKMKAIEDAPAAEWHARKEAAPSHHTSDADNTTLVITGREHDNSQSTRSHYVATPTGTAAPTSSAGSDSVSSCTQMPAACTRIPGVKRTPPKGKPILAAAIAHAVAQLQKPDDETAEAE